MNPSRKMVPQQQKSLLRCAIYTRKSTEEGLEQEFNSLDAQRESGEAYIKSQVHEGWECIPTHYDDGGFTGGNMDRPALKRLMADIDAGKVDLVLVYKVDRLTRSLLDFGKLIEVFDQRGVSFVSATQQFNSSTSMGRLMLNVLLSFAQFEREIISERTRDKIAAARRKGKWAGGHPILGYDILPQGFKLVVNEDEATRVRAIFQLYLQHEAMQPVVDELERRGWCNKRWITRKGRPRGGKRFTKTNLHKLLTNVAYIGKVRHKLEIHDGEQQGIVEPGVWQKVQAILQRNGRSGGAMVRNKFGCFLKGLLRCVPCGCAMTPSHSTKSGSRRYRYYVCSSAQKRGWHTCPSKSISAHEIERFVLDQIKSIGKDPDLVRETLAQANEQGQSEVTALEKEQASLQRELARYAAEIRDNLEQTSQGKGITRLADLQERIRTAEARLAEVQQEFAALSGNLISANEVATALADFEPVWAALTPLEQTRMIQLLIEQVTFDGRTSKIAITFHAAGLKMLALENSPMRIA